LVLVKIQKKYSREFTDGKTKAKKTEVR
jgi:hypothetical protein